MTSANNIGIMGHLGTIQNGWLIDDDKVAGSASSQSGANPITSRLSRCTVSAANGSFVLPSILTRVAPNLCVMVNDSGQTIKVYCFAGENMNGVANTFLSIADGAWGIFSRLQATNDWRAAAIS